MKKCYTITLLCLLSASLQAQIFHWIGPSSGAGGAWNDGNNWSLSFGGPAALDFPKDVNDDAVFDQNALVNLSGIASFPLNSLRVALNRTATLFTNTAIDITVSSNAAGGEGLRIDAGSTLRDSVDANVNFRIVFTNGSTGEITGDLFLTGNPAFVGNSGSSLSPGSAPSTAVLTVGTGGRIIHRPKSALINSSNTSLILAAGSFIIFERDGLRTPNGSYSPSSTVRITGNTTAATQLTMATATNLGNVEYDCPGLTQQVGLGLVNGTIQGSLRFLNTNNQIVAILQNPSAAMPPLAVNTIIGGNLEIGGNSLVTIGADAKPFNLQVNGNYVQTGGIFSIQHDATTTFPTRLSLRGNYTQSVGIFTATSTATSASSNLFILEMNGAAPQTISSVLGTIDNVTHQVALRLNNPNHITLNSPLAVGRIDFASGRLITSVGNAATITNTDNNPIDISGASASSHVQGPLKRRTALAATYRFPVGKGGSFRFCEVIPTSSVASEYSAEYFNAGHPDLSTLLPLTGVASNEYWDILYVSGTSAAIKLTLNGAVPGAGINDAVVVAHYNGADWVNERGTTGTKITPGNASSGTCTSQALSSFSPFTFGFGPESALPIKLDYFNVVKGSGFNTLHWKADCYSTQAVFELERSSDGRQFNKIKTIVADQQRCLQPFDYQDNSAGQGTVYYRVHVVDVDGSSYYSRIVAIVGKNSGFDIVGIYPTVVSAGQLKVNIASGNSDRAEIYITNATGQIVKKLKFTLVTGENIFTLSLPELAAGVYQLSGFNSEGQVRSFRFIKQ